VDCDKAREVLSDYLSGALPAQDAAGIEAHVASCQACAAELEALKRTETILLSLSQEEVPESVWHATAAQIGRAPKKVGFFDWVLRPAFSYAFSATCVVAALALVLLPLSPNLPQTQGPAQYVEATGSDLPVDQFVQGTWGDTLSNRTSLGLFVAGAASQNEENGSNGSQG
jgi:anti-sigma factor RsiW